MTAWGVAKAKAQFSAVLDKAESEGPQLVRRRDRDFYVVTKEQLAASTKAPAEAERGFVSGWDALRPSSGELFDVEFPRLKSKSRVIEF